MAKLLDRISAARRARGSPSSTASATSIKRAVLDAIGYFDEENFASGYCEENDFCYRAGTGRLRAGGRRRRLRLPRQVEVLLRRRDASRSPSATTRSSSRSTAARRSRRWSRAWSATSRSAPARERRRDALVQPACARRGARRRRERSARRRLHPARPRRRRLGWLALDLPGGHGAARARPRTPGSLLSAQALGPGPVAPTTTPTRCSTPSPTSTTSRARPPRADVISATHFKSVALLAELRAPARRLPARLLRPGLRAVLHLAATRRTCARRSTRYTAIPDCLLFAKTHWLCNIVGDATACSSRRSSRASTSSSSARAGAARRATGRCGSSAMVRPRTPRRQPTATVAVLERARAAARRRGRDRHLRLRGRGHRAV